MVEIIYGAKGSGKTKRIIESANNALEKTSGYVVYVTDTDRYRGDIDNRIRYIDVTELNIASERGLSGFVKGLIAGNYDIQYIYIDGAQRITGKTLEEMEKFYEDLGVLSKQYNVNFVLTISRTEEDMPDFLEKYIK
ncbi:MAG: ATP-binding protein [Clostridia bacterium]|nr:ATP-binding protein [Clostridia bacterium]MDY5264817.1 ATP-binding protein [Eubacteriales bacterium]MDY5440480.1 ATP-binding protein [Eubacteriales bacterium]